MRARSISGTETENYRKLYNKNTIPTVLIGLQVMFEKLLNIIIHIHTLYIYMYRYSSSALTTLVAYNPYKVEFLIDFN